MPTPLPAVPESPWQSSGELGGVGMEGFDAEVGDTKKLPSALLQAFMDENVVRAMTNIVQSAVRAELLRSIHHNPLFRSTGHFASQVSQGGPVGTNGSIFQYADNMGINGMSADNMATAHIPSSYSLATSGMSADNMSIAHIPTSYSSHKGDLFKENDDTSCVSVGTGYMSSGGNHAPGFEDTCDVADFSEELQAPDYPSYELHQEDDGGAEVEGHDSVLNHHPKRFDTFKELQFQENKAKGRFSLEFGGQLNVSHVIGALVDGGSRRSRPSVSIRSSVYSAWGLTCIQIMLFVESGWIDYVSAIVILGNAVTLGIHANYMIVNVTEEDPPVLRSIEVCFCIIFTVELCLRIFVNRCKFFSLSATGWKWNWFDFFVVVAQIVEELMTVVSKAIHSGGTSSLGSKFGMMRVLRLLRLVRIMRLLRVLHLIGELRTLVVSLFTCARSLGWTIFLVFLTIYIVSIYIMQSITTAMVEDPGSKRFDTIRGHFSSFPMTMLTLYQSITGGLSWHAVLIPLNDHVSPTVTITFLLYVSFSLLALFNIVTGVFVENALLSAKKDQDLYMLQHVCELFRKGDAKGLGYLNRHEFIKLISEKEMQSLLKDIGLAPDEVLSLFKIIDVNGDGKITPDEFLNGCLRCRGDARAYEQAMIAHELTAQASRSSAKSKRLNASLSHLSSQMNLLMMQMVKLEGRPLQQMVQANLVHASLPRKPQKPQG